MAKESYETKSAMLSRKPRAKEEDDFKTAVIALFEVNNPHKAGAEPTKILEYPNIEKIRVRRSDDNKVVTAISDADHQLLVDSFPNLTANKATKQDISLSEASRKLGYGEDQISNFTRLCKTRGYEIYEKKFDGRTHRCISIKNFKEITKVRDAIATTDID